MFTLAAQYLSYKLAATASSDSSLHIEMPSKCAVTDGSFMTATNTRNPRSLDSFALPTKSITSAGIISTRKSFAFRAKANGSASSLKSLPCAWQNSPLKRGRVHASIAHLQSAQ